MAKKKDLMTKLKEIVADPFRQADSEIDQPEEKFTMPENTRIAVAWVMRSLVKETIKNYDVTLAEFSEEVVREVFESFDDRGGQRGPVFGEALELTEILLRVTESLESQK